MAGVAARRNTTCIPGFSLTIAGSVADFMYMRTQSLMVVVVLELAFISAPAVAKDSYRQRGLLSDMQSVQCGTTQKSGTTVAGALITGSKHSKTQDLLCQEYTLKTDRVTYRIRPRDEKHPVLLPVGEEAEFRLKKDKMVLRIPELDDKDREYQVLSMTATSELAATIEKGKHPPKPHGQELSVDARDASAAGGTEVAPSSPTPSQATPASGSAAAQSGSATPPPRDANQRNGFVQVQSTPTGAQVFVDSALAGRTPSTLQLSPGAHTVQVVLAGYKDFVANIDVLAGAQQQLTAALSH